MGVLKNTRSSYQREMISSLLEKLGKLSGGLVAEGDSEEKDRRRTPLKKESMGKMEAHDEEVKCYYRLMSQMIPDEYI